MTSPKPLQGMIDELLKADVESTAGPYIPVNPSEDDQYIFALRPHNDVDVMIAEMRGCGAGLSDEQMGQNVRFFTLAKNTAPEIIKRQAEMIRVMQRELNLILVRSSVEGVRGDYRYTLAKEALARVEKLERGC